MKIKHLLLLCIPALIASCLEKPDNTTKAENTADPEVIETLTDYQVPVMENCATIVTLGDETLAITTQSMSITVPREAVESGELKVTYSQDEIYKDYAWARYWQYISFEDTRNGDYDYNDLVIHCRVKTDKVRQDGKIAYKHVVSVQPVALGGTRQLKLGILYKENAANDKISEKILCNDVREELFFGNPIFPINTDPTKEKKQVTKKLTPMFECINSDETFKVVWFIENETDRMYAATTNLDANRSCEMISPDGLPYGISLTKKWNYPAEKCYIGKAYPSFSQWITTGDENMIFANQNSKYQYPACKKGSDLIDLWDWED